MNKDIVKIYVDGSIRGNGKEWAFGGIGVVAYRRDECIMRFSQLVKASTNNESEYIAVYAGVKLGEDLSRDFIIYSDSELVVKQILGEYQVKKQELLLLYNKTVFAMEISNYYKGIQWISRVENTQADKLAQSITKEAL